MNRKPVTSSNVVSVGHENGVLEVEFKGGAVYQYFDVPASIYLDLLATSATGESVGKYLTHYVKSEYRYAKVS